MARTSFASASVTMFNALMKNKMVALAIPVAGMAMALPILALAKMPSAGGQHLELVNFVVAVCGLILLAASVGMFIFASAVLIWKQM